MDKGFGMNDPGSNNKLDRDLQLNRKYRNFRREVFGISIGIGLAMMLGSLVPAIRERVSLGVVFLWGGAIGGIFASAQKFEQAGAALTKKNNKPLNYAIGIGIPALIFGLLLLLGK
jgi:hypothetical protein